MIFQGLNGTSLAVKSGLRTLCVSSNWGLDVSLFLFSRHVSYRLCK